MKANELRLGNWVLGDMNYTYQIELSDFYDWYNDHNSHEFGDHIHPVPITEEWLINFGFEKDSVFNAYFINCAEYRMKVSINLFSGTLENDPSWFVSILIGYGSQPMTVVKKYVHELQNLYFELSNKELDLK